MIESFGNIQENTVEAKKAVAVEKCQKLLDELDERCLEEIFNAIVEKAGVPEKKYQYIPLRDVKVEYDTEDKYAGRSSALMQNIQLNAAYISVETPAQLCKVLIHEELHALSRGETTFNNEKGSVTGVVGFREEEWEEGTNMLITRSFELFNEGMTELITDDVYATYVHRTGNQSVYREYEGQNLIEASAAYTDGRIAVNAVIEQIARESGVDRDRVREAFVRCYFEGRGLTPHNDALEEVLGKSFKEDLGALTEEETQERMRGVRTEVLHFLMFDYTKRSLLA
jgi:hypothetical protein